MLVLDAAQEPKYRIGRLASILSLSVYFSPPPNPVEYMRPMNRILLRFVAMLLVPCLITGPAYPISSSPAATGHRGQFYIGSDDHQHSDWHSANRADGGGPITTVFTSQALALPDGPPTIIPLVKALRREGELPDLYLPAAPAVLEHDHRADGIEPEGNLTETPPPGVYSLSRPLPDRKISDLLEHINQEITRFEESLRALAQDPSRFRNELTWLSEEVLEIGYELDAPGSFDRIEGSLLEELRHLHRRHDQLTNRLGQMESVARTPPPAATPAVQRVIESLGQIGKQASWVSSDGKTDLAISMLSLGPEGRDFFHEIFGAQVENHAQYLWTKQPGATTLSPLGIVVREPRYGLLFFFYLAEAESAPHQDLRFQPAKEARRLLAASGQDHRIASVVTLRQVALSPEHYGLAKDLRSRFAFAPILKLWTLTQGDYGEKDFIFGAEHPTSSSFQQVLGENHDLFKDADVREVGVGSGVNLIHALRYGASSIEATDTTAAYCLLARWNLQLARETHQVPEFSDTAVRIFRADGFGPMSLGTLYLGHLPSVRSAVEYKGKSSQEVPLMAQAAYISAENFRMIMDNLKDRLMRSPSRAIWRVIPSVHSGLSALTEEQQALLQRDIADGDYRDQCRRSLIAENYLNQAGFVPTVLRSFDPDKTFSGVYGLKSNSLATAGPAEENFSHMPAISALKSDDIMDLSENEKDILRRAGLNLPYSSTEAGAKDAKELACLLAARLGLSGLARHLRWGSIYYRLMAYAHEHRPPIVELGRVRLIPLLDELETLSARLGFTPVERRVFEMLWEGLSDEDIDDTLGFSPGYAKAQVSHMKKKFEKAYQDNAQFDALRGDLHVDIRTAAVLLNVYRPRLESSLKEELETGSLRAIISFGRVGGSISNATATLWVTLELCLFLFVLTSALPTYLAATNAFHFGTFRHLHPYLYALAWIGVSSLSAAAAHRHRIEKDSDSYEGFKIIGPTKWVDKLKIFGLEAIFRAGFLAVPFIPEGLAMLAAVGLQFLYDFCAPHRWIRAMIQPKPDSAGGSSWAAIRAPLHLLPLSALEWPDPLDLHGTQGSVGQKSEFERRIDLVLEPKRSAFLLGLLGISEEEIAAWMKRSVPTIQEWRRRAWRQLLSPVDPPEPTVESQPYYKELQRLLADPNLSQQQIAGKLGINQSWVSRLRERYGLPPRAPVKRSRDLKKAA